jgi:Na+/melibiose symporter-like transporter
MQETSSQPTKIPSRVWVVILAAVLLSLSAILLASYIMNHPEVAGQEIALYLLLLGAVGVIFSAYTLFQIRNRLLHTRIESPPITTTVECKACGFKNVRAFQRGDYIFKEGEPCEKCKAKTLITAIYREVKDKEKDSFPS